MIYRIGQRLVPRLDDISVHTSWSSDHTEKTKIMKLRVTHVVAIHSALKRWINLVRPVGHDTEVATLVIALRRASHQHRHVTVST